MYIRMGGLQLRRCQSSVVYTVSICISSFVWHWETAVAQWLMCCVTNRKVAGSIPDGVIGIFH